LIVIMKIWRLHDWFQYHFFSMWELRFNWDLVTLKTDLLMNYFTIFYAKLLHAYIDLKSSKMTVLVMNQWSTCVKDTRKHLSEMVKLTAGLNFTNIFTSSFYTRSSQKRKNSAKSSVFFYAFGIYGRKSC